VGAAVAAATWAIIALNVWFTLRAPFEVEVREGTSWLHVLAADSGVSLYDHSRVAFLNMNHGPLDPVFKTWIHRLAPALPPQVVTRAFVPVLPAMMLALFFQASRRWIDALVWSGGIVLLLYGLGPMQFLIGRSDPAAVALLCALLLAAQLLRKNRPHTATKLLLGGVGLGALASAMALTNSRYMLTAGIVLVGYGVEYVTEARDRRLVAGAAYGFGVLAAMGLFWVILVETLFHGDIELYYRHFFGVFTRASGWGAMGRMPYELFPAELREGRFLLHLGLTLTLAIAVRAAWPTAGRRMHVVAWALALSVGWAGFTWAFAFNHGGAALQYFAPIYIIGVHLARTRIDWAAVPRVQMITVALAISVGLPWSMTVRQALAIRNCCTEGRAFADEIRSIVGNAPVYSEDIHLFRRRYNSEVIDVGDMVTRVARRNYFGPVFRTTVERQLENIRQHPPRFVLVGSLAVVSDDLRALLEHRYAVAVRSGPLLLGNYGAGLTLYRLRQPESDRVPLAP
jgi:hypothetical protein